jgi:hypothetical protein
MARIALFAFALVLLAGAAQCEAKEKKKAEITHKVECARVSCVCARVLWRV